MKIESLVIKQLYGHMDFDIKFFPNVNFLTGINGSGKTSVLNVLAWILSPSLMRLSQLQFNSIKVTFSEPKNESRTVKATKRKNEVELTIEGISGGLRIPIFEYMGEPGVVERTAPTIPEMYERFHIEHSENPVLAKLEELVGPLYLPLDRRWKAAPLVRQPRLPLRYRRTRRPVGEPIGSVLYLAERYYREQQYRLGELNEKLREEFVESTFGDIFTTRAIRSVRSPWTLDEVKKRKETIVEGLANAGIKVPEESVSEYFRGLERIARALERKGIDRENPPQEYFEWVMNMPQIQKVERLIKRTEEYNNQRDILLGRVVAFKDTVNSFLCDTDKQILYDTSGELFVKVGEKLEISPDSLSSGEIQLLTLFTYLYFGFRQRREFVVMIDEPELSLHLEWQHKYVESVMKANPNAQFIFATHAPEIAQGYDDYCIELSPKV